ncbi:MAG: hypothetical protein QY317_01780 [Candidatus Jettenia caeni]|nr:MAG: hypothetical protein QY317_01780 [Candidatus Jettenia caeni]
MSNKLETGQRLKIGDKLVSLNNKYTLVMQEDGNLVLYKDSISVDNAYWYWDTGTCWLPEGRRPIGALMQDDANFVFYDTNGKDL